MMKKTFFAPLGLAILTLFACEKDTIDDTNNNGNNGSGGTNEPDTIAPVVNNFTINGESDRVYVATGSDITAAINVSDNQGLMQISITAWDLFTDFGAEDPSNFWMPNEVISSFQDPKAVDVSRSIAVGGDLAAGPYEVLAVAADNAQNTSGDLVQVILTKDKQPLISLPDNGSNTTVTTSLAARPPKFNVKAQFDDGEGLTFRNLSIYPKSVDESKTPFYFDGYDAASGNQVSATYLEIVPDDIATGTYEYAFSAGDSDGNVTVFFGDFIITE